MQRDQILESLFRDTDIWRDVIAHGVEKRLPQETLEELADPHIRAALCMAIGGGEYHILPPRTGYRKKDDGSERVFLINTLEDRLVLNAVNRWLMRHESGMIHPACKSYQAGMGVGRTVREISRRISHLSWGDPERIVGRRFDIRKYFDSVNRQAIYEAFTRVERDYGESSVVDMLRAYYDSDVYYDSRECYEKEEYMGIKQGCAVSAWLANVLLYPVDEALSARGGLYVRYSDDILYIGEDYEEATSMLRSLLAGFGLKLHERKIADLKAGEYFRFLGYDIHGADISLSAKWVKSFQEEVDRRTVADRKLIAQVRAVRRKGGPDCEAQLGAILRKAERRLARFLLYGDGRYSWSNRVLPTVNNLADLRQLTLYCLDALRAVYTGNTRIGGLGKSLTEGILRGKGRHVRSNREATRHLGLLEGFLSLAAVKEGVADKWLHRALAVNLVSTRKYPLYGQHSASSEITEDRRAEVIAELERLFGEYLVSRPTDRPLQRFYAFTLDDMTMPMLLAAPSRTDTLAALESYLLYHVSFRLLTPSATAWYWQSSRYPQLVLLRSWFHPE